MADPQPDIRLFNQTECPVSLSQATCEKIAALMAESENGSFNFIEVVYVDEKEIIRINKEHLDHDYVTDIITFRYDDQADKEGIEGTLFCCAPRILEQAKEFGESPEREFLRIFIHGLLHLIGYDDKSDPQKQQMTQKEDHYLALA